MLTLPAPFKVPSLDEQERLNLDDDDEKEFDAGVKPGFKLTEWSWELFKQSKAKYRIFCILLYLCLIMDALRLNRGMMLQENQPLETHSSKTMDMLKTMNHGTRGIRLPKGGEDGFTTLIQAVNLFNAVEKKDVLTSTICWTTMAALLVGLNFVVGPMQILKLYGIPYWKYSVVGYVKVANRDLSSKMVDAAAARNSKDTNGYFLLLVLQRLKDGLLLVYKVGKYNFNNFRDLKKSFVYNGGHVKSSKGARPKDLDKPVDKLMFVCTKDATLYVYDGYDYRTFNSKPVQLKKDTTAISMHVIVEPVQQKGSSKSTKDVAAKKEPSTEVHQPKNEHLSQSENTNFGQSAMDSLVILCCKDALCLYPLKSAVQIFARPRTGESKTSLMSILRWSFKANMERTLSSMENGQIAMKWHFSLYWNDGNNNRIDEQKEQKNETRDLIGKLEFYKRWNLTTKDLESLPSLHDKVLAAALEAAINSSQNQKKKPGKENNDINFHDDFKSGFGNLDRIFSKDPFPDPLESITNDQEDEREVTDKSYSMMTMLIQRPKEIIAKYRKAGNDASSAAEEARNKLLEQLELSCRDCM
ncbi:hypothetical protein Tco_1221666 [Tanacetum coccineum]